MATAERCRESPQSVAMATFARTVDWRTLRGRTEDAADKRVCGFYSLDGRRRYRGDLSELRYLRLPRDVDFDLDVGTDDALRRDDARPDPKLDNLLTWLRDARVRKDLRWKPEIVTNRGTLLSLMHTPFEEPNWRITATLFAGTVYLFGTWKQERPETEENRRRSMWGLKFEEYVTTDRFQSDTAVADDQTVEDPKFYAVFAYETRKHRVLYGAEIDCVESTHKVETLHDLQRPDTNFVEFKTNRIITKDNQWASLERYKFPKWWEQCFLTNIDKVVCGFRTDSGIVKKLGTFTTYEMLNSRFVRDSVWSPRVCLNFMDEVLSFIKSVVLEKDRNAPVGTVWEFEVEKPAHRYSQTIEVKARRQNDDDSGGDALLPTWFTSSQEEIKPSRLQ